MKPLRIKKLKGKVFRRISYFNSITSTSDYLIKSDSKDGDIAVSGIQTKGRGKQGAKWLSKRGGLWFSFVRRRKIAGPYIYVIISSVAVAETLVKYGIRPVIKWPNDILVNNKKICGIIIDNDVYNRKMTTGIGLNVNNSTPQYATSVKKLINRSADTEKILFSIISRLNYYLSDVKTRRKKAVEKWIKFQSDLTGREIKLAKTGKKYEVVQVDSSGNIRVKDGKGKGKVLKGEIFFA